MMAQSQTVRHPHDIHPHDIQVEIHYHGRHFLAARGHSLSRAGMYLDVRNLTLPVGTQVELELENLGQPRRLEAVVIHRSPTGVGVRFVDEQPDLDTGLEAADAEPDSTEADPLMPPPRLGGTSPAAGAVLARAHD